MTFQCGDCRICGKCYPKKSTCVRCGEGINLADMDKCPCCGNPITDEMREAARQGFMRLKREQYAALFPHAVKIRDRL